MTTSQRAFRSVGLLVAALCLQVVAFLIDDGVGGVAVWTALAVVVGVAWFFSQGIPRTHVWIAAFVGATLGFVYCYIDLELIRVVFVRIMGRPDELVVWAATFFSMLIWPFTLVCAGAAVWGTLSAKRPE